MMRGVGTSDDKDSSQTPLRYSVAWQKKILNLVNPSQICIVITLFLLLWHQAKFRLAPIKSEKGNHNPNLVWVDKIQKIFLLLFQKKKKTKENMSFLRGNWRIWHRYPRQITYENISIYKDLNELAKTSRFRCIMFLTRNTFISNPYSVH